MSAATLRRDSSIAWRDSLPIAYRADGLPYFSERYGRIASATSSAGGVVAAWSM